MTFSVSVVPAPLRWIALAPLALLAAGLAQLAIMGLAGSALSSIYGSGVTWPIWTVKSGASLFMGAAFVSAAAWVAPSSRRTVASAACAVVGVWAVLLMVGGPVGWGLAMGGLGLAGAVITAAVVWRMA